VPQPTKVAPTATKSNDRKHATQQSVDAAIWSICDIMRRGNVASALQYVPELTWILFLRILDETEDREAQEADAVGASYTSSLKKPYRWKEWAAPLESAKAKANKRKELEDAGNKAFMNFVNGELIPYLKKLKDKTNATPRQKVISEIMSGVEKTRIDTEKNLLDVLDKVHEITNEGKEAREATNKADGIESAVYDLKAVNPNRKTDGDRRTPAELLDLIEAKGRDVAEALAALRNLTNAH
jgi:type I restriction-modification system DNA methylase subunit